MTQTQRSKQRPLGNPVLQAPTTLPSNLDQGLISADLSASTPVSSCPPSISLVSLA